MDAIHDGDQFKPFSILFIMLTLFIVINRFHLFYNKYKFIWKNMFLRAHQGDNLCVTLCAWFKNILNYINARVTSRRRVAVRFVNKIYRAIQCMCVY